MGKVGKAGRVGWSGLVVPLAATLSFAASGPCVDEEALRELEARRAALLSERLPKEELWALVERRGRMLEQTAALRRSLEAVEARTALLEARAAALEAALEQVRSQQGGLDIERSEAEAVREHVGAEVTALEREVRALGGEVPGDAGAP